MKGLNWVNQVDNSIWNWSHLSILLGSCNLSIGLEIFLRGIRQIGVHHTKPEVEVIITLSKVKSSRFVLRNVDLLDNIFHGEDNFGLDCLHINKVRVRLLHLR